MQQDREGLQKQALFTSRPVAPASANLLLSANPLEDVRNSARIDGVMVRGCWYTRAELNTRLEALATSFTTRQ